MEFPDIVCRFLPLCFRLLFQIPCTVHIIGRNPTAEVDRRIGSGLHIHDLCPVKLLFFRGRVVRFEHIFVGLKIENVQRLFVPLQKCGDKIPGILEFGAQPWNLQLFLKCHGRKQDHHARKNQHGKTGNASHGNT